MARYIKLGHLCSSFCNLEPQRWDAIINKLTTVELLALAWDGKRKRDDDDRTNNLVNTVKRLKITAPATGVHHVARNTLPSHLLDFPRELRNTIYHKLWKMTPKICTHQWPYRIQISYDSKPKPDYERIDDQSRPGCQPYLPTWLLTNKQIPQEGLSSCISCQYFTVNPGLPGLGLLVQDVFWYY